MSDPQLQYIHDDILAMREEFRNEFASIRASIVTHTSDDNAHFSRLEKDITEIKTRHSIHQESGTSRLSVFALLISAITAVVMFFHK